MFKHFQLLIVLLFSIILVKSLIAQPIEDNAKQDIIEKLDKNLLDNTVVVDNYYVSVRKYYEKILEIDSTDYNALTNLGVIYQHYGDLEKSLLYFEQAVKFHPQKSRPYHNLGILNSIIGNLDEAVLNLNKAAELDLPNPNSVRQLGIIYLQNEMYNEAIAAFYRALKRDKFDTESRLGKALAYWSLKEYDKVLAVINEMQSLGLRFNRMELLLADVYFKKKDYETAMRYARLDKTENSSKAEGHYLLGVLYKMKDEKDKAEYEFEEAYAITQQNPTARLEFSISTFFNKEFK